MVVSAGTRLGPYEILAPIGKGGMGEVWKARDTRLGRDVAIKISAEQFSERFEREARAVAALNHPNICTLHDVGPNYLVMELVEGPTLADRIKEGPISLDEALNIARQVAEGLEAAHEKGITHRDLKPGNIKIKPDGTVKALDFGLAKMGGTPTAQGDESPTLTLAQTEAGMILGTASYMSPEQAKGKPVDARSDIYAFGAVLYEMLTGKRLHRGETTTEILASVIKEEPQWDKVPPQVQKLLRRCLEKDPQKRLRHIGDVMALVENALAPAAPVQVPAPPAHPKWPWIAGAAAAVVVGATIGAWAIAHFRQVSDDRASRVQLTPPEGGQFMPFGSGVGGFSLSPDGRSAAYVVRQNGKTGLWVRSLDSATARQLPGTERAGYPFWSPDSKSIAFAVAGKLERIDVVGGEPLTICEACAGNGGAWSNDGRILLSGLSGLRQVPATGGTPSNLTTCDKSHGELSHEYPQILPGGRLLYWVQSDRPETRGVYVASLAKPTDRVKVLANDSNAVYASGNDGKGYLLWLRGSTLLAQEFDLTKLKLTGEPHPVADPVGITGTLQHIEVAPSNGGQLLYTPNIRNQFTWFDRTGKLVGTIGEPGEYITFRISPDGRQVVASRDLSTGTDLWMLDTERGVASKFTFNGTVHFPIWSPDGKTVMYRSFAASVNLFRKDSSGSGNEQRLELSPGPKITGDWSRDGREVLYGDRGGLWVLPVTPEGMPAGNPKRYLPPPFAGNDTRLSPEPNPHWIAYRSSESGTAEIYVNSFPEPRNKFQISSGGGRFPVWNPSGHEMYYVSPDNKLMAVSLKIGDNSVEPSAPRELFHLPAVDPANIPPYDIAPDGQRFLVRVTQPPVLNLILNWTALLKKGQPTP